MSSRAREDVMLPARLERAHSQSDGTYGAPRLHADLVDEGIHVGRKRVARLMRASGLRGFCRRKRVFTTVRDPASHVSQDLVQREFNAGGPDQLWVADITYVPTWSGFLYLAIVLDAWSRRVVGWSMSTSLKTQLVLDALDMAIWKRQPENVIHHSDHGCQYTSIACGLCCKHARVCPSMGSVG
jgi:putative transposase